MVVGGEMGGTGGSGFFLPLFLYLANMLCTWFFMNVHYIHTVIHCIVGSNAVCVCLCVCVTPQYSPHYNQQTLRWVARG